VLQALEPKKKKANNSGGFRNLKRVGLCKMNEDHKKEEDTSVEVVTKEVKTLKVEAETLKVEAETLKVEAETLKVEAETLKEEAEEGLK